MIIEQLTLHNYGLYTGRQTVELRPPSEQQPIVLFGGQNGAGKTTFLDALLLVLYGKKAKCSNRGTLSYDEFLLRSINDAVDPREGASIEISFSHTSEGVDEHYNVRRTWFQNGSGAKEVLEVKLNDRYDQVLSESWSARVDEFIPHQISNLFFFDGEQIEDLANLENSSAILSSAIHSLLGLDLVEQLIDDLGMLKRKKKGLIRDGKIREAAKEMEKSVIELNKSRRDRREARAKRLNDLNACEKRLQEAEERFRRLGGHLLDQRTEIETTRERLERSLHEQEEQLLELSAGPAPLNLVRPLLLSLREQTRAEKAAHQARQFVSLLDSRDSYILAKLRDAKISESVVQAIDREFESDRTAKSHETQCDIYVELSEEASALLEGFCTYEQQRIEESIRKAFEKAAEIVSALIDSDRKLASIPDEGQVRDVRLERSKLINELAMLKVQLALDDEEIERATREIGMKETALRNKIREAVKEDFEDEVDYRVIQYADKSIETLGKFRGLILKKHIKRIAGLVFEGFTQLLRKKTLIRGISIDPETFTLSILGPRDKPINPKRLSAGERQLLAVSILWGLARAAGRPLPVAIDTPLGRLDSRHRSHLVERYFPYASHQVFLFSTDEEITGKYLDMLSHRIGHTYHLEYSDHDKATRITKSYFS